MKAILYPITAAIPNRMAIVARPRGGDWLGDELRGVAQERIDVLVSMLTEEESNELGLERESQECKALEIKFVSFPIPDRGVPPDRDGFLRCVEELATMVREEKSLAVHCRAGIGRSSVLLASILVRLGWDPGEAFAAIQSARGCPTPDTPEQRAWVGQNVPRLGRTTGR